MTITISPTHKLYDTLKAFNRIKTENDLKRYNLTLAEYRTIEKAINEIYLNGSTTTFLGSVADFLRSHGLTVWYGSINWHVS